VRISGKMLALAVIASSIALFSGAACAQTAAQSAEGVKQAGRDHAERAHVLMKARAEEQERIKQNGGCIPGTHRVPNSRPRSFAR